MLGLSSQLDGILPRLRYFTAPQMCFLGCGGEQRGAEKPLMIVTGLELMVKPIDAE